MPHEAQVLLTSHLNQATGFKKPPTKLRSSFKATSQLETQKNTEGIFAGAGFQAWLAYFLTSNATLGTKKYRGKANERDVLEKFENSELKQEIAQVVNGIQLEESVAARVKEWEELCRSGELI